MQEDPQFRIKADYYTRTVITKKDQLDDDEIKGLKNQGLKVLEAIIKSFNPEFAPINLAALKKDINAKKAEIKRVQNWFNSSKNKKEGDDVYEAHQKLLCDLQNKLKILEDYNTLFRIQQFTIPQADQKVDPVYFQLQEPAGGVTEKISLCSRAQVKEKLENLLDLHQFIQKNPKERALNEYSKNREHFKLSINAMLKLPKRKKITEVMREAVALAIAENLGFRTTKFIPVSFKGKPALFIPFEKIQKLDQFAKGKQFKKKNNKTYTHYAVISPIGEGIFPNRAIENFGYMLAYAFLCNDTDFIGGYLQNKALIESIYLYIFDQSLFDTFIGNVDHLIIDSRCSLIPNPNSPLRHSKHRNGRNRQLVDDHPLIEKIESIFSLMDQKQKILDMIEYDIIREFKNEMQNLKNAGKNGTSEYKSLKKLYEDAKQYKKLVEKRFERIFDHFPKYEGVKIGEALHITKEVDKKEMIKKDLTHALMLEKILNCPRIFTRKEATPFRSVSTYRNKITIKNIRLFEDSEDILEISFSRKVNEAILSQLVKQTGVKLEKNLTHDRIKIHREDLYKIQETSLLPEAEDKFNLETNYLDRDRLAILLRGYDKGNRSKTLHLIKLYQDHPLKQKPPEDQGEEAVNLILVMKTALKKLNEVSKRAEKKGYDKGFVQHVLRNLNFEIQQTLQKMILNNEFRTLIANVFNTAVKLDRVSEFNQLLMEEMEEAFQNNNNARNSFVGFLKHYGKSKENMGHDEAVEASKVFSKDMQHLKKQCLIAKPFLSKLNGLAQGVDADKLIKAFETATFFGKDQQLQKTLSKIIENAQFLRNHGHNWNSEALNCFLNKCINCVPRQANLPDNVVEKCKKEFLKINKDEFLLQIRQLENMKKPRNEEPEEELSCSSLSVR